MRIFFLIYLILGSHAPVFSFDWPADENPRKYFLNQNETGQLYYGLQYENIEAANSYHDGEIIFAEDENQLGAIGKSLTNNIAIKHESVITIYATANMHPNYSSNMLKTKQEIFLAKEQELDPAFGDFSPNNRGLSLQNNTLYFEVFDETNASLINPEILLPIRATSKNSNIGNLSIEEFLDAERKTTVIRGLSRSDSISEGEHQVFLRPINGHLPLSLKLYLNGKPIVNLDLKKIIMRAGILYVNGTIPANELYRNAELINLSNITIDGSRYNQELILERQFPAESLIRNKYTIFTIKNNTNTIN